MTPKWCLIDLCTVRKSEEFGKLLVESVGFFCTQKRIKWVKIWWLAFVSYVLHSFILVYILTGTILG